MVLTKSCLLCSLVAAAIIPIPAMRAFVLQMAVICGINLITSLTLFPCIACWDLSRRKSNRYDFLCCLQASDSSEITHDQVDDGHYAKYDYKLDRKFADNRYNDLNRKCEQNRSLRSSNGKRIFTNLPQNDRFTSGNRPIESENLLYTHGLKNAKIENEKSSNLSASFQKILNDDSNLEKGSSNASERAESPPPDSEPPLGSCTINFFCDRLYVPFIQGTQIRGLIIFGFLALLGAGVIGTLRVEDGLKITEIVPRYTSEHDFLDLQTKYFSFYMMYAVTQGNFDYPANQKLLYEYHHAFTRINNIIKVNPWLVVHCIYIENDL